MVFEIRVGSLQHTTTYSLLNILSEDVEFKLANAGDKFISIDMVDKV